MARIIIELSNNLTNWVSQINGVDIYEYCEQGSFSVRKGYTFGDKHLTNTLSFNFESTQDLSTTIQLYRYCRMRIDDVVEFVGIADDTSATVTIAEVDRFVTSMKYKDVSSAFSDATFSSPSVNPYDDDQIALEISADDNVQVCAPDNPSKSLVHILFSMLATEIALPITIDAADISISDIVQYFSANIGDKVLDVITEVLTEAGLTYWCDTLAVHLVDLLAVKTAGTTIPDIERNAKINKKTWIETAPPSIKYPSVMVRENQQLYTLGPRKDEFTRLYWKDGDTTALLSAPDSQDEGGHRITPVAYYDLRAKVSSSAKEIRIVNFKRQSFNTVTYNIENPHKFAGLRVVHKLYNAWINGTVKCLVYDSEELPSNGSDVSKSCKYIYSKAMAQRFAKAYTIGRKMQQAVWSFYAMEKIPVDSVVRIEGVDVSALRITAVANDCGAFGGYTYTASPYSLDVPITFTAENRAAVLSDVGTNRNLELELTGTQFVYFADGTPVSTDPIRVWINAENLDGVPMLYVSGVRVDLYQDYAPENEPEGDHVYTGRYYYDLTPYATAAEDNTITLSVQIEDKTATANVYKVVNGSVAISIQSVTNEYAVSDSATTAPTTGWSPTIPPRAEGQTLWVRDVYTYTDGNVAIIGARPVTGDNGRGVKSVANYYAKSSSSTVAPSSWEPEPVTITPTEPYLWTYSVTTYTDDSTASTTPAVIGTYGKKGDTGATGQPGKDGQDGKDGQPAKVFEIYADKAAYTISKRQIETQTAQLAVDRQNVEGTITWDIPQGVEWNPTALTITIPAKTTTASYTISATLDGITRSVTITGVAEEDIPEYLGALSTAPSTVARIDGDHYLNTSNITPYVYSETANSGAGGFIPLTTSSPYYYTVINDTVADFGKMNVGAPEGSVFENYYDSIAAQSAFIKKLGAQNITILPDGTIESQGHEKGVRGFKLDGATGIIDAVGLQATEAEISGAFKAQALETTDMVPAISTLQNFSATTSYLTPAITMLPTFNEGLNYEVVGISSNSAFKFVTTNSSGQLVYSSDGLTLNKKEAGVHTQMIVHDPKSDGFYLLSESSLAYLSSPGLTVTTFDKRTGSIAFDSNGIAYIPNTTTTLYNVTIGKYSGGVYQGDFGGVLSAYLFVTLAYDSGYIACYDYRNQLFTGNGGAWTKTLIERGTLSDIIGGGGYFVMIADDVSANGAVRIMYTRNHQGTAWNEYNITTNEYSNGKLFFINGRFFASINDSLYSASPSSMSAPSPWTKHSTAPSYIKDLVWNGTRYTAVSQNGQFVSADLTTWTQVSAKRFDYLTVTPANVVVGAGSYPQSYVSQPGANIDSFIDYFSNLKGNGVTDDNGNALVDEPLKLTHAVTGTLNGQALAFMKATQQAITCTFSDNTTKTLTKGSPEPTATTLNNVKIARTAASVKLLNPQIAGRGSVPIGFIYTQYPNQSSPELLFDGEWTDITSQYAGAFFRAGGGDALAFGTKQSEGLPNIKGNINVATWYGPCGGAFLDGGKENDNSARSGSGAGLVGFRRNFDASKGEATTDGIIRTTPLVYGKSDHVTPVNYAVRIWKRTN